MFFFLFQLFQVTAYKKEKKLEGMRKCAALKVMQSV